MSLVKENAGSTFPKCSYYFYTVVKFFFFLRAYTHKYTNVCILFALGFFGYFFFNFFFALHRDLVKPNKIRGHLFI